MTTQSASIAPARGRVNVVGARIGAAFIDGLVLLPVSIAVGLLSGGGRAGHGHAKVLFGPGATLIVMAIGLAYFFVCEATWGRTIGKRAAGVRVTTQDGEKPGAGQVLVRTLLRLVDALPVLYLVGLAAIVLSGRDRRQRVGDLAASTVVRGA